LVGCQLADKSGAATPDRASVLVSGQRSEAFDREQVATALETVGVRFIDEDEQDGLGVRLQNGKPAGKRK
jgi:hypothetical protein